MTDVLSPIIKTIDIGPGAVDPDKRLVSGWISTIDVDMDGEVVLPDAMDDSYFSNVRTVTLYHDDERVVGTNRTVARRAKGLWAVTWMMDNALGEDTLKMIKAGVIRCFSIEADRRTLEKGPPTPEERRRYGEECRSVWRRWTMLAYSFVGKPSNPHAVIVEKGRAEVDEATVKGLEEALRRGLILRASAVAMGLPDTAERKLYRIGGPRVRILSNGAVVTG